VEDYLGVFITFANLVFIEVVAGVALVVFYDELSNIMYPVEIISQYP
jgi:hypothetical protein